MTTIRPNPFPQAPLHTPGSPQQDTGKLSAQRAFFAAAMGETQAPAAPAAPPAPAPRMASTSSETPQRILRPGSILDIRV